MADIKLVLIPSYPLPENEFSNLLTGFTIDFEVYDLNILDLEGSTDLVVSTGPIDFSGYTPKSGAEVTISLGPVTDEYDKRDLRIKMFRDGDLIVDEVFNYNFDEDGETGAYIVVPPVGPNIMAIFRNDGLPPLFSDLEAAVNTVLADEPGSVQVIDLDEAQCRHVAKELVWAHNQVDLPKPDKKIKKLYTAENADGELNDGHEEKRQKFESALKSYYDQPNRQAENLAKFIYALRCAYKCHEFTINADEMIFHAPLRPGATDVNRIGSISVIFTGSISSFIEIDPQYFYALGAELPIQIDENIRFKNAITTEAIVLHESFKNAKRNNVIDIDVEDLGSPLLTNKYEAARRLTALNINNNNVPICIIVSGTDLYDLVDAWSYFAEEDIINFWNNLSVSQEEAHSDLVVCAITHDNTPLTTVIDPQVTTVSDLENASLGDWEAWFIAAETAYGSELELDFITPGLPMSERAILFGIYAQNFFNITTTPIGFGGISQFIDTPVFGVTGPIEDYITNFGITTGNEADIFPDDECAQQWLKKRIEKFSELIQIVQSINTNEIIDPDGPDYIVTPLQLSIAETLHHLGFTSLESIASCSFEEFQSSLINTSIYSFAEDIYAQTNPINGPSSISTSISDVLEQSCVKFIDKDLLGQVLVALSNVGINDVTDFSGYSLVSLQQLLEGVQKGLSSCAQDIWKAVDDLMAPEIPEGFRPINDGGKLTNCIPPDFLSPLGQSAYLHSLLNISTDNTCQDNTSRKNPLNNLLIDRRGDLNSLSVSASNYCTPIPTVDLAIERLEAMVIGKLPTVVKDTPDEKFGPSDPNMGHYLDHSTANPNIVDRPLHDPTTFFRAVPAHSSPLSHEAYDKLKSDFSSCAGPYNQAIDVNNSYLTCIGSNRYEVLKKFRKRIHEFAFDPENEPEGFPNHINHFPVSIDLGIQYLGISMNEYDMLFTKNIVKTKQAGRITYHEVYGTDHSIIDDDLLSQINNLCTFLKTHCLSYCEFKELAEAEFYDIKPFKNGDLPECEPCDCGDISLTLSINDHKKLIAFIRLWKKLEAVPNANYSILELKYICEILGMFNGNNINPDFIRQLVAFQQLRDNYDTDKYGSMPFEESIAHDIHSLVLWMGTSHDSWDIILDHFLDQIRLKSLNSYDCTCRPPSFKKVLLDNLDQISILAGFDPNVPELTWYYQPTSTLQFAEILSKICSSTFEINELLFLFTNDEELLGGDPFALQTRAEAKDYPFDMPGMDEQYSLDALRTKILAIIPASQSEIDAYTWNNIYSIMVEEYDYDGSSADVLQSVGEHFFPSTLTTQGYTISNAAKQYRAPLASTAPMMWNTGANNNNPFLYDTAASELYVTIPIEDNHVIAKLARIAQLDNAEQTAVKHCYFAPRLDLANIGYLFSNFNHAQDYLVNEVDETKRWEYFCKEFISFHRSSKVVAKHLADHLSAELNMSNSNKEDLTWQILKHIVAVDNKSTSPIENDNGHSPDYTWDTLVGGAFAALTKLRGSGLLGTYQTSNSNIDSWRAFTGDLQAFGIAKNNSDTPIPTIISNLDLINSFTPSNPRFASIKNGFAIENSDGDLLGGAEGYTVCWEGILYVDIPGKYTFRAGAPTPGDEFPDSDAVSHAEYSIVLQRSSQQIELISRNDEDVQAPSDCSTPVQLKRGAYDITIKYTQPQPTLDSIEEGCPHRTGFQVKWHLDGETLHTIPISQLYTKCKDQDHITLGSGVENHGDTPLAFLNAQYHPSIFGIRSTYQLAFKSLLFACRFNLSAAQVLGESQSEIGHFLDHADRFAGQSYYQNPNWTTHKAGFDFNLFPYLDNYCKLEFNDDNRVAPTTKRSQALFNWWIRICDYTSLREKTSLAIESPVWRMFKEATENHPDQPSDLLYHMGIDMNYADAVTQFLQVGTTGESIYDLTTSDLEDERWAIRVCEAAKCLEHWLCMLPVKEIRTARPDLWASTDPSKLVGGETYSGNEHLTQFIRMGLIESDSPKQYNKLKDLNDGIRDRSRKALISYLINSLTDISDSNDLSTHLLINVEVDLCKKSSRIQEAISSIQKFITQYKLGIETDIEIDSEFIYLWNTSYSSFELWKKCHGKKLYQENWIQYDRLNEARGTESFRHFERRLKNQTLAIATSGGAVNIGTAALPQHKNLSILQKKEASRISFVETIVPAKSLLGTPIENTQSWLSTSIENQPVWYETVHRLTVPFIKISTATDPLAGIDYGCDHSDCCNCCKTEDKYCTNEYYFWLLNTRQYHEISQELSWYEDPNLDPDIGEDELLFMNSYPTVFLLSAKRENGKLYLPRRSKKGIEVNDLNNLNIEFQGRVADSLNLKIDGAVDSDLSFWFNLVNEETNILPQVGYLPVQPNGPSVIDGSGNSSIFPYNPYFLYFDSCMPVRPKSNYAFIVSVAGNLVDNCNFEGAVQWLEQSINPNTENNEWVVSSNGLDIERKSLLLLYINVLNKWGIALSKNDSYESFNQAQVVLNTAQKYLGEIPKSIYLSEHGNSSMIFENFIPSEAPLNPQLMNLYCEVENNNMLLNSCINSRFHTPCAEESICDKSTTNVTSNCYQEFLWCLPESPYRFQFLLSKAQEYASFVSGLGSTLLTTFEKEEGEYLNTLRETQAKQILDASLVMKEHLARESNWNTQATQKSLELAMNRLAYQQYLIANGLISEEEDYLNFTDQSMIASAIAQGINATAGIIKLIPDAYVGPMPLSHVGGGEKTAGSLLTAGSNVANIIASIQGTRAGKRATEGSWARRLQEWQQRVSEILIEIEQIKRQLQATKLREKVSLQELNNHRMQMVHTDEIQDHIRNKFTNYDLYQWTRKELISMYYAAYDCALRVAHQAQMAYNFECDFANENFLKIPIWNELHKGLLSGEKIQLALRSMEKSYLDKNVRQYELTKHISLRSLDPIEFLRLKNTGKCLLSLPEELFNQDYPSHYLRRIKSVSLSIPCVVGPYTSVNCKLTLLNSKTRIKPSLLCHETSCCEANTNGYLESKSDTRFVNRYGAKDAIATSSGQNESGMFELNFNDNRYLHFECEGVISKWCLELPIEQNFFDMQSLSDVIMHVNYMAKEGGELLGKAAKKASLNYLPGDGMKLLDVRSEFPDSWYEFEQTISSLEKENILNLKLGRNHFPFIPGAHEIYLNGFEVFFEVCGKEACNNFQLGILIEENDCEDENNKCDIDYFSCVRQTDFGCMFRGFINIEKLKLISHEDIVIQLHIPEEIQCIDNLSIVLDYGIEKTEKECCGCSTS